MKKLAVYLTVSALALALIMPLGALANTGSSNQKNYRQYQNKGMKKGNRYYKKTKAKKKTKLPTNQSQQQK